MINSATMINCKLADIASLRGYKSAKQLTDAMNKAMGLGISYSTIYPLWRNIAANYARVTLDRLCEFLNTSPGVLLEYAPGNEGEQQAAQSKREASAKKTVRGKALSAGTGARV
jgi:DNA-binding Xre family transcriptional regulator